MSTIPNRYSQLFNLSNRLMGAVEQWAETHDAQNDSYHRAKNLWERITTKCYSNSDLCLRCVQYLQSPSTVVLKELLAVTDYNDESLCDVNAMSLLDTCSIKIQQ